MVDQFIRCRSINADSLDLEQEVDPLNVDHFSCTPLVTHCSYYSQCYVVITHNVIQHTRECRYVVCVSDVGLCFRPPEGSRAPVRLEQPGARNP